MSDLPDFVDQTPEEVLAELHAEEKRIARLRLAQAATDAAGHAGRKAVRYARYRRDNRAQQAQAANAGLDGIVEDFNYWAKYRDRHYIERSPDSILDEYRTNRGPKTSIHPGWEMQQFPRGPALPPKPISRLPRTPQSKDFLAQTIPNLSAYWKGKKFLGEGSWGMVGLWEYTGTDAADTPQTKVAVKQGKIVQNVVRDLEHEAVMMDQLGDQISDHLVRLISMPQPVEANDALGPEWTDKVGSLIMEYCPVGSLWDLLSHRSRVVKPFNETTLWRMFDCLIDGFTVLDSGFEASYNNLTGSADVTSYEDWDPMVHFDIKPENILLGKEPMKHAYSPIYFGLAERISEGRPSYEDRYEHLRMRGTPGYYTPEQFTERWDYYDFMHTEVAGLYSTKTNVWGIGALMYELICLHYNAVVDITKPFYPPWTINGSLSKGITYGLDLKTYCGRGGEYSRRLIELVWECLYEKPANRPGLLELKERVTKGFLVANEASARPGEPWEDFEQPDPSLQAPPGHPDPGGGGGGPDGGKGGDGPGGPPGPPPGPGPTPPGAPGPRVRSEGAVPFLRCPGQPTNQGPQSARQRADQGRADQNHRHSIGQAVADVFRHGINAGLGNAGGPAAPVTPPAADGDFLARELNAAQQLVLEEVAAMEEATRNAPPDGAGADNPEPPDADEAQAAAAPQNNSSGSSDDETPPQTPRRGKRRRDSDEDYQPPGPRPPPGGANAANAVPSGVRLIRTRGQAAALAARQRQEARDQQQREDEERRDAERGKQHMRKQAAQVLINAEILTSLVS